MRERSFSSAELDEWFYYYDQLDDYGPYHHPEYISTISGDLEFEEETAELYVLEGTEGFIYYPYIKRPLTTLEFDYQYKFDSSETFDIISSWYYGGALLSDNAERSLANQFADAFSEFCVRNNIVSEFVRFDPNAKNHEVFSALEPIHNRKTVWIDLLQSKQEIWDSYEGRNQRAIKQAKNSDLYVEVTRSKSDYEAFHELYSTRMVEMDAADHYRFSYSSFEELLVDNTDLMTLIVVRDDDELVGGFIAAHTDQYAHHFLSAADTDYWDQRINNLLYHNVVMEMKESGKEVFDFQGGREGVFKFKKGFSDTYREFHVAKRIHDDTKYSKLVRAATNNGIDTDKGYFPEYREKQS